jgi:acetate kinase
VRILVVNAGSSSLKLAVVDDGDRVAASANLPARGQLDEAALRQIIEGYAPIEAVGHRVVHGGTEFVGPVILDPRVAQRLRSLTDLAPLHQPTSLRGIDVVTRVLPEVLAVACFDTAFHAAMPAAASTYALPPEWRERWQLRRFGFHGLSHAWASRQAGGGRVVTCHLGAGASLAAVRDGRCVDTTMGFTPLEGLVMATRSGSVDPGLLLWLLEETGMPERELAEALEHRSGVFALAGTADMREVVAQGGLALDVYLHRLRASIAAMTAALGGLDTLVFTGGVGERSPEVRAGAADGLGFLGVELDPGRNNAPGPDSSPGVREIGTGPVRVLVVEAREDLEIARGVRRALA